MPRTRLTGFSRLLIFLVIFLPLAYFGASYYNGEDPIANIRNFFSPEPSTTVTQEGPAAPYNPDAPESQEATFENVNRMRAEITKLRQDLALAEERLARCETGTVE